MFGSVKQRLLNNIVSLIKYDIKRYTVPVSTENNKNDSTIYPPILSLDYKAVVKRHEEKWYDEIKNLETVEEKLFKINIPRYYGWKGIYVEEGIIPYNALCQAQYITRTHVVKEVGLPSFYNNIIESEAMDLIIESIKNSIEDSIAFEYSGRNRKNEFTENQLGCKKTMENITANAIASSINRVLLINLSSKIPHLLEAQVDYEPRTEAFWCVGGIDPPRLIRNERRRIPWKKDFIDDPINRWIHYKGHPVLHLRHNFPLKEIISLNESENPDLEVPQFKLEPRMLGYHCKRQHGVLIPGFWPGDSCEFGFLSYHNRGYLHIAREGYNDTFEALTTQAIFASYSWLLSQACYQGFSIFNDITYPLTTQTIITNGQWWSFCVYQLNTTLVHSEYADSNPRRNICWITEPMKLFDEIENEKVHGLNVEVLKHIIKFYVNAPQERTGIEMKPYLGKSVKVIADITDGERREWLENHFKHLVSNRPRHKRIPEIYDWQKIYIIRHNTRPMDKKREPWESGINKMRRRLDDALPVYIPRCLRENPKKRSVGRWRKTYFP